MNGSTWAAAEALCNHSRVSKLSAALRSKRVLMSSGCERCLLPGVRANGITSIGGKAIAKVRYRVSVMRDTRRDRPDTRIEQARLGKRNFFGLEIAIETTRVRGIANSKFLVQMVSQVGAPCSLCCSARHVVSGVPDFGSWPQVQVVDRAIGQARTSKIKCSRAGLVCAVEHEVQQSN